MIHFTNAPAELIEFTRIYLAVFYSLVAAFYTIRIVLMKRSSSSELVFTGKPFCSTWWNHMTFRFFRIVIWMVCLFRLVIPSVDNYLGMIASLEIYLIILAGNILLTIGFFSTIIIHIRLGKDWRSGIDPAGPNNIISTGVYKFSRNPMFLCIVISQIGFFLALPSLFSLICLTIGVYTLYRQVIAEEKHLMELFPIEFKNYSMQVHRWI
jgi:protein-S-isoprenylcysteine O-methyltransferase Ste14